jgi:2-dehydro-3-deoxyphosphooctonate aldolase (KDO 8-P synthase)
MDMESATATTATSPFFDALRTAEPFFVMAGPNVIESEEHALKMARQIKSVTDESVLQQVKTTYGLPIVTDVHEAYQVSSISSLPHHKSIGFELCD